MNPKTPRSLPPLARIGLIIAAFVAWVALSCGDVPPTAQEIRPPAVNAGMNFQDFLRRLGLIPRGMIPPPWIDQPNTIHKTRSDTVQIHGWGPNRKDRPWTGNPEKKPTVVVYSVQSPMREGGEEIEVGRTDVNDDRAWTVSVKISAKRTNLVARVWVDKKSSWRSNPILAFLNSDPAKPEITEPQSVKKEGKPKKFETEETVIPSLKGTAESDWKVVLLLPDGKKEEADTFANGSWDFGKRDLKVGDTTFRVALAGIESSYDELVVTRYEPVMMTWPFGEVEGENYKPNLDTGTVTAWMRDDWHRIDGRESNHTGIDISVPEQTAIHAVAKGTVLKVDWNDCGGNYVLIDHGSWVSYYGHMYEKSKLTEGKEVKKGDDIGKLGNTGSCTTGAHLHFTVRRWEKDQKHTADNFWSLPPLRINPPFTTVYENHFKAKNINFYDYYGLANFWEIDWTKIKTNPETLPKDYNERCSREFTSSNADGLGFRYVYCKENPERCPCKERK
jgi:murein DD-endopeptidase MepM/ murein hydrolase activator NlpD